MFMVKAPEQRCCCQTGFVLFEVKVIQYSLVLIGVLQKFSSSELSKNGDEWTMTWKTTMMSNTVKFTVGVEFVEKNPKGKETKVCLK